MAAISRCNSSSVADSPIFAASPSRSFRWTRASIACFFRLSALAISGVNAGPYTSRYVFSRPATASDRSFVVIVSPPTVAATFRSRSEYVPTPHQMKVNAMKERMNLMAQEPAFRRSTESMAKRFSCR